MGRALEGQGRSVVSGGRGVLDTVSGSSGFSVLDDFEGYTNSSEINDAYDNATNELTLRTDGLLQSAQYVEESDGKWFGNSGFVTRDGKQYALVVKMNRNNGTAGLTLHAQDLSSSQDIVNNCLRVVIRGDRDEFMIAEYNDGYNRHWSTDFNFNSDVAYIITGWTDGDWAIGEIYKYSDGMDGEPLARVSNNGDTISWNEGFFAFEGDADGTSTYFDYFRAGGVSTEDTIEGTKVIDDFEGYGGKDSQFREAWSGLEGDWELTTNSLEGNYSIQNTGPTQISYEHFLTQEGFKYSAWVRADRSTAVAEFHVNKQDVTTNMDEIGARVNFDEQEFYVYTAESGQELKSLAEALNLSTDTDYKVEVDMNDGDVAFNLKDANGNILSTLDMTNDTSYSGGIIGVKEGKSFGTTWDDIKQEDTELGAGDETGGGGENTIGEVDYFEDQDLSEYVGATGSFSVQSTTVAGGDYALEGSSAGYITSREGGGLSHYPQEGDTFKTNVYLNQTGGQPNVFWCVQDEGNPGEIETGYYFGIDNTNQNLNVWSYDSSTGTFDRHILASYSQDLSGQWLTVHMEHRSDGSHYVELRNKVEDTTYTSGSGTPAISLTSGGIKIRKRDVGNQYFDSWRITDGPSLTQVVNEVTIEDFEDGDISEYTDGDRSAFATSTARTHSGTYSLESQTDGSDLRMWSPNGNGLGHYPKQGDEWEFYVQTDTVDPNTWGVSGHIFAAQSNGGRYRARIRWHDNAIQVRGTDGSGNSLFSDIVTCPFDLQPNTWYRVKLQWDDGQTFNGAAGDIQATIYDANSSNSTTASKNNTKYTQGGLGWSIDKYDAQKVWFDDVTLLNPSDGTTSPEATIDSFEDASLSEYSGETSGFSTSSSTAYLGENSLLSSGGGRYDIYSTSGSGLSYYPAEGDTFEFYTKTDTITAGNWNQSIFKYGLQSQHKHYSTRLKWNTDEFEIGKKIGDPNTTTNANQTLYGETLPFALSANTWYRITVDWRDGSGGGARGDMNVTIEEVGGSNSHTISANDTDYSSGGIGWAADRYNTESIWFDHAYATKAINGGDGTTGDGTGGDGSGGGGGIDDPSTGGTVIHDFENADLSAYNVVSGNSAAWQFTDSAQEPLAGGAFYDRKVSESQADFSVSTESGLETAANNATSGDIIYITDDIDTVGRGSSITIPSGVTLAGDRGINGSRGPRIIYGERRDEWAGYGISLEGNNRVTGIRMEGPHYTWSPFIDWSQSNNRSEYQKYEQYGMKVNGSDVEIDNCELYAGGGGQIAFAGGLTGLEVHHCHIHRGTTDGFGYGMEGADGATGGKNGLYIHDNVFHYTRHDIAGKGTGSYYAENNISEGPKGGNQFDMHESGAKDGGDKIEIFNNFFPKSDGTEQGDMACAPWSSNAYDCCYIQRGTPSVGGYYDYNWGYNPDPPPSSPTGWEGYTINQASDYGSYSSWQNVHWDDSLNQYGRDEPSRSDIGLLGDGRQLVSGSSHALRNASGRTWTQIQSDSGLNSYPSAGDKFEFMFRVEHDSSFHAGFLFGVQDETTDTGHYEVDISNGRLNLELDHHSTSSGTDDLLGDMNIDWKHMETYRVVVDWPSDPELQGMTVEVYNVTRGNTLVNSMTAATDSTYTSGGIGFFSNSFPCVFFDNVRFVS